MRVIAGKYRGRRLLGPRGLDLRPSSDRLKETLFNVLRPRLCGAAFLDAFAGTGSIGIEALSLGAASVVFVDSSEESCRLLRRNLEICGITEGFRLLRQDIFKSLRQLGREGCRFDIVFLDPPYGWGPYADLLETVFHSGLAGTNSQVILEHHRRSVLPEAGRRCCRLRVISQGNQCLSFYSTVPDRAPR